MHVSQVHPVTTENQFHYTRVYMCACMCVYVCVCVCVCVHVRVRACVCVQKKKETKILVGCVHEAYRMMKRMLKL